MSPKQACLSVRAVLLLATLALVCSATDAAAQSCCSPNPCGAGEICSDFWSYGPDGEAFCEPRCSPPIEQCNNNHVCDPGENVQNCVDCCVPTQTCAGQCGNIADGCGNTLHCGACSPCNGNTNCDAGETHATCPLECPPPPPPSVCGNGYLEAGEDCASCWQDAAWRPTFMVDPPTPVVGQPVTLRANPSLIYDQPGSRPRWDLGNTQHREGNPLVYTYPAAGSYRVVLTASEWNCGRTVLAHRDVTVSPRPQCDFGDLPPELHVCCGSGHCDGGENQWNCPEDCRLSVSAGGPYVGSVGVPIAFVASAITGDPITSYSWDFGDGATSSAANPTHAYGAPGSYTVSVEVATAHASGDAVASVRVHGCNANTHCEEGETSACSDCSEQPLCGNGKEDYGEDCSNCPRDVARKPTFSFSPWLPFVGDAVVFTAAADLIDNPSQPLWDLGDTQHRSGNPYTHVYTAPGKYTVILTASESKCHTTTLTSHIVDVQPRPLSCNFNGIPPHAQRCCGNEDCNTGEGPNDCPSDCAPSLAVTAGGPYRAEAGQPVQFRATVPEPWAVTSYLWSFGDGTFSSQPEPVHAYAANGRYDAQVFVMTAATSGSATARVFIGPIDDSEHNAVILEDTFLPTMVGGVTYQVTVRVQNTGLSTWVSDEDAGGDKRGFALAAKNGKLIEAGARFTLPPGLHVPPGTVHDFVFDVVPPVDMDFAFTELQMVVEKDGWFGQARYLPVNLGPAVAGALELRPAFGPPGTPVEVHLSQGFPFPPNIRGRFNFGEPGAFAYSLVTQAITWDHDHLIRFTVPATAGCGDHYLNLTFPTDTYDPWLPGWNTARFVVTAPCDPTRRNSLSVLSYNVQFLPDLGCYFGGSPAGTSCYVSDRLPLIAAHPDLQAHDVMVFEEAFINGDRRQLLSRMKPQYPYVSPVVGGDSGLIWNQNGGVVVASKWPIEASADKVFFHEVCSGVLVDCRAKKGILYARINKGGVRYGIFGTHTDAGDGPGDRSARLFQLIQMRSFIDQLTFQRPNEPVVIAGDFNIDARTPENGEYHGMLSHLDAIHPPTTFRDPPACPSPLPPPPLPVPCTEGTDCEVGQQWYAAYCDQPREEPGQCRYVPTCFGGGTNLDGNLIDYVLYRRSGHPQPSFARNLILQPVHPNSPYPGHHLSDHFPVLGEFRFDFAPPNAAPSTAAPTTAPSAQLPSAQTADPTPTFTWEPAVGADSYALSVSRGSDGEPLLREQKIAGLSYTPGQPLPSDVDLRWEVKGENMAGAGPVSASVPFRIRRDPGGPLTAAPEPAWPLSAVPELRPVFAWTAVEGATSYALRVANRHGDVVLDRTGITTTTFTPLADLPVGNRLFWSVRAESEAGPGPWAQEVRMRIVPIPNDPPVVDVTHTGTCDAGGCTVTFTVAASDPDGNPLSMAWSGCGSGTGSSATCRRTSVGSLTAEAIVTDGRGGTVMASDTAGVAGTGYTVTEWSPCAGTGPFTCTSTAVDGCTRQGTKSRTVTVTSWALDAAGAPAPLPTKACNEKKQGYVASYDAVYTPDWTCTAAGSNGCYKDRVSYSIATYGPAAPDAPIPAARIYTTGYVTSWNVGPWDACPVPCGGGWQNRTVTPAGYGAVGPGAPQPGATQPCHTHPCQLTCYHYNDMYPTQNECRNHWPSCCIRYPADGVGGLLTCWKGFSSGTCN